MSHGRIEGGRFASGNNFGKGRPRRQYSISTRLAEMIDETATVDEAGEQQTNAEVVARWLMKCAVEGVDEQRDPDSDQVKSHRLGFRDRMDAIRVICSRIEPEWKGSDGDEVDPEAAQVAANVGDLSDEELAVLQRALGKAS